MTNEETVEEHIEAVSDRDLLIEIRDELRRLNEYLTSRNTHDRLNEEMDLVK